MQGEFLLTHIKDYLTFNSIDKKRVVFLDLPLQCREGRCILLMGKIIQQIELFKKFDQ